MVIVITVNSDNVTLFDEDTERKLYPGELTIEEAIAFGKADTWNDEFDRDQIPGIKRTLTQAFRAYRNQQGTVCYE